MSVKIVENIDWVGAVDWNERDFHEFDTPRGVTYNAYLVRDEKKALIDTVKSTFSSELLLHVQELVPIENVDYIVINHAEPDHSSSLPEVMKRAPKAQIVCTEKCRQILSAYYDVASWKFFLVKSGDKISLGKRTLSFIETPMVHWPESMFTYVEEEKILFSMDAFGQHLATSQKFDDQVDSCSLFDEAKKYYANIIMPYGKQVERVLENLKNLPVNIIAPAHGVIWKKHVASVLSLYKNWAAFRPTSKILVIYDSMWGSTTQMAKEIVRGASNDQTEVKLIFVRSVSMSEIVSEVLDASCIVLGSSTQNVNVLPKMGELLTYLKGLKPKNKIALAFGCFGWGKGSAEILDEWMISMEWEMVGPAIKAQWKPSQAILQQCYEIGQVLAKKTKERML